MNKPVVNFLISITLRMSLTPDEPHRRTTVTTNNPNSLPNPTDGIPAHALTGLLSRGSRIRA